MKASKRHIYAFEILGHCSRKDMMLSAGRSFGDSRVCDAQVDEKGPMGTAQGHCQVSMRGILGLCL